VLAKLLADMQYPLAFNIVDLGAVPLEGMPEPFLALLNLFPRSRISAFELDPVLCEKLNGQARSGLRYYAYPIGRTEESRTLYETVSPVCASLYEPDERFADVYNDLDVMRLKSTTTVRTTSLDTFVRENGLGNIDFIKMDVQGAELDVLQGGTTTLSSVLAIVSEVEFVPLYKEQPLYGDIDAYLRERDFMLRKFLTFSGRVMKSLAIDGNPNFPSQLMWADALFTCDLTDPRGLSGEQLLKLAVLLDLYNTGDGALYLLRQHDRSHGSALAAPYLELLLASGWWTTLP
jgi:FkbM family methyltransferase